MGSSVASLLVLAVLFTLALTGFHVSLSADVLIDDAMLESGEVERERHNGVISYSSVNASEIFSCASKIGVEASNVGDVPISNLDKMDLLTWYIPQTGGQVTERFVYKTGNIEEGQWTLFTKTPNDLSPFWEPDEVLKLISRLSKPPKPNTSGYVILSTPGGVSDGDYLEFSDGALGECRFLHNNPSPPEGGTASQWTLPMDTGLPLAQTLHNYDTNRDSSPGLRLARSGNGLGETSPEKFQAWRTGILTDNLVITGDVLVNLWGALSPPIPGATAIVITYLRDYDGLGGYVEIGDGAVFARDWQSGSNSFVERVALITDIDYTVPSGHQLELKIVVDDASNDDMEFAYDVEDFPSLVNLSFFPPIPTTSLYLHNLPTLPTGDTSAQPVLPIDTTPPIAANLFDYDLPDKKPGLTLKKSLMGLSETDPEQFQVWRTGTLSSPMEIAGDVFVSLWSAIRNFQNNQSGAVTMYLRDYDGSAYTEIANGSVFIFDWQKGTSDFINATIMMLDVNYTVPTGHELEARLIADDIKASKDMWFAYDTAAYPSVIKLP